MEICGADVWCGKLVVLESWVEVDFFRSFRVSGLYEIDLRGDWKQRFLQAMDGLQEVDIVE